MGKQEARANHYLVTINEEAACAQTYQLSLPTENSAQPKFPT